MITRTLTIQLHITARVGEEDNIPTPDEAIEAYRNYTGNEILTGWELAESGYVDSKVEMVIAGPQQIAIAALGKGFQARFVDNPGKWEFGRSPEEALGKLVLSHSTNLGIQVNK